MRKLVLSAVAVAFAVVLASFAPRPWSPAVSQADEPPTLSALDITPAGSALPETERWDAH